jgi:hypothetical protein
MNKLLITLIAAAVTGGAIAADVPARKPNILLTRP